MGDSEEKLGRRALFGRTTLLAAGAAVTLLGLTGCPGGEQDDDGDDDDGGDDDD
ncbi:hypothetical protein J2S43_001885 [Catenuloplanes nepalensis]|uniref:Uncharacterized protein n=1 Tax=Catenuloplanes nepalensis TaxID=587533 RepID=A0ABT9MPL8_9ACTN|nr:hypothetical protein [Catenuloplanes nepalensis]MDP9793373.1 hypothetical protein [Catenuloplanes nepalensis]